MSPLHIGVMGQFNCCRDHVYFPQCASSIFKGHQLV